jgi:hypothetical protein
MDDKRNCSTCANGSTRYEQPTCTALSVFAQHLPGAGVQRVEAEEGKRKGG